MNIIVDTCGGDNGAAEAIKGCVAAAHDFDVEITLVGNASAIRTELEKYSDISRIHVVHADGVIDNYDSPVEAIKRKKDSSMVVGFRMLKEGSGDGFLSAGNTGALLAGATLIVGRLKGVERPALAPFMPKDNGVFMLLDAGANTNCKPVNLVQFAIMASSYVKHVLGIQSPKVALLNVGTEDGKGDDLRKKTFLLLKQAPVNFVGNIEARDIPYTNADIVVADGFTGNVTLKLYEGVARYFINMMKGMFLKNIASRLAAIVMRGALKEFKNKMDYTEYGGAPLLGVKKPVFKTHGSSKAKEFYHTIEKIKKFTESNILNEISDCIKQVGVIEDE